MVIGTKVLCTVLVLYVILVFWILISFISDVPGQSLNLTGNVWGDPQPEVSWLKNDKELVPSDHIKLKFEAGKFASITIAAVSSADSGKYALLVKNKYGTEAGEFTVSVYIPEDDTEKKE